MIPSITRHVRRLRLVLMGTCFLVMSGPSAHAADKMPVSALPLLPTAKDADAPADPPKAGAIAGIAFKDVRDYRGGTHVEAHAATSKGYCLVSKDYGLRLSASTSSPEDIEVWRLSEAGGKAQLERTRLHVIASDKTAWSKSRTTIELAQVSRSNGVTVWGLREGTDVILIARGAEGGRESTQALPGDSNDVNFAVSDCSWGATRLDTRLGRAGSIAQLRGALPAVGEGKQKITPRYVVNGSLAKLSRDPEPVIAVHVQLTGDS